MQQNTSVPDQSLKHSYKNYTDHNIETTDG